MKRITKPYAWAAILVAGFVVGGCQSEPGLSDAEKLSRTEKAIDDQRGAMKNPEEAVKKMQSPGN